ncbi:four-carbon acid sugar kinase family protein [Cypionkella sp.]|jgi:uncharacterized protein YgbK (DUF1537 family)|uniref:four-carbon acid sugar kinase family protein n=1 Tax=Cypionkella sp. TaxID=2811411 RepID=UPI00272B549A|nr:four-carbon acid sugar kinase family protein [Cypionkella sp.]MDP2050590.1 four-carbon acid sugar kinase family protein [Cypionkella sp.]
MTPSHVTILSDDLTGALDAAAPLAQHDAPIVVSMTEVAASRLAVSTETRDGVSRDEAARRVAEFIAARRDRIGQSGLWIKKIDSMLRGPWAAETAAAARDFDCIVVAPAFPEMGRRTVNGRQQVLGADSKWQDVGEPIATALQRAGLHSAPWRIDETPPEARILVADAVTPEHLDRVTRSLASKASVLWVGSGGVAEALAGRTPFIPAPTTDLFLIGTRHPVTQCQTARLEAQCAWARLVDPAREVIGAREAAVALNYAIVELLEGTVPVSVLVTGGATLAWLTKLAAVDQLHTIGRIAPGLPVSYIHGGAWHGVIVISKSGGFGDPDLLVRLALSGDV